MRGVRFEDWDGDYVPRDDVWGAANEALEDIALWLGFVDLDDYLEALPIERERIFDRAKD